ncbi:MAG: MBL fold metallo-hydrolase [Pseudomonadota bacterium]
MLCRIGEVEIWRILDILGPFMAPEELFPNAPPDIARLIEEDAPGSICPDSGKIIFPIQGFLLKTPTANVLVDTCVGCMKDLPRIPDWHMREDDRFLASLTAAGLAPGDVDYVLCTHLHADHVGWNTQLVDGRWVPTFPRARYLMPEADEAHHRETRSSLYTESVLPVIAAGQAELVSGPHMLGGEITLLPTPGHSAGHVAILIRSGGREALITGDAIHTTAQCRHPHWHFKFDADPVRAEETRKTLLAETAEARRLVLGSHFTLPSLGHVEAKGDAFRWRPL